MGFDELTPFAFFAVAEVFDLDQHCNRVVVVKLKEIDLLPSNLRKEPFRDHLDSESGFIRQHVADLVLNLLGVGDQIDQLVRDLLCFFLRGEDDTFRARARHHTIEEANWIGNHPRIQIILKAHGLPQQRLWILPRVFSLRDSDFSDLF